jgi:hypothetical protein
LPRHGAQRLLGETPIRRQQLGCRLQGIHFREFGGVLGKLELTRRGSLDGDDRVLIGAQRENPTPASRLSANLVLLSCAVRRAPLATC